MKTSEDLILEAIEDSISKEMKYRPPINYIQVGDYESSLNSFNSCPPLDDKKWVFQKSSNRPLNNQYIEDNMKKCMKIKHTLEHEKTSKKFFDFESRFTLEKIINHTDQLISLLEKCKNAI